MLAEQFFGTKMATSEKFQSTNNPKTIEKTSSIIGLLTGEHIKTYKFHIRNCLWLPIDEQIFDAKMATSGKFQLTYNSKPLKKQVLL